MFPGVLVELIAEDMRDKHAGYIRSSKMMHTGACLLPLKPVAQVMEFAKAAGVKFIYDFDVSPSFFVEEMQE